MPLRGQMTGGNDGQTTTNASTVLTFPAGTAVGDIGIIVTAQNTTAAGTVNTPTGWTLLAGPVDQSTNTRSYLFGKVLDSSDVAAGSVTVTAQFAIRWVAVGQVRSGVSGFAQVASSVASGTTATATPPTVTTTTDGREIVSTVAYRRASSPIGTATWPAGWTEGSEAATAFSSGAQCGASFATLDTPGPAGTYGGANVTLSQSEVWVAFTLALTPAATAATGTASLGGSGVLSAVGTVAVAAAVALGGSGSLGATGAAAVARAATLSGAGSLAAQGALSASGTAGLGGAGSLTAQGASATSATATLAGSAALTTAGAPSTTGTAALSGAGALIATGAPSASGQATLTGAGTLTANGAPAAAGTAALGGSGQLTALNTGASALAALGGTGTLTATGRAATSSTAALTGTGSLTATARVGATTAAALSGDGTLIAAALPSVTVTVALAGTGDLSATSLPNLATTAALTGDGTLAASGTPGPPPETAPQVLGGSLQLVDPTTRLVVDVESGLSVDRFDSSLILTAPATRLEITT